MRKGLGMDSVAKMNRLKEILGEVADLTYANFLLDWDQQCYMPEGGAEGRSYQSATLQRLAHERLSSEETGRLLDDLKAYADQLDPDSDDARLIRVTRRRYDKKVKVPASLVSEFSKVCSASHTVWAKARSENRFIDFRPQLEKIVELRRQYAACFEPYDHVYDPLLDDFEPGLKTAEVRSILSALRPQQVALIKEIGGRPQVDDAFLHQNYDEKKQWEFGVEVVTRFGYDWKRGRQDKAAHPFSTNFCSGDVRITTRVLPDFLSTALFGTMHECGHALYEQGVNPAYDRHMLSGGASLGVHESQSRMWENLVGRSRPFWEFFYPRLQEVFPAQLGNVTLDAFYKGVNRVAPSLIRVEADEATYNLHVMLRLELEIALMDGSLAVKDLPEAWNARVKEYLGVTPPNDAKGVLQDVHWSSGYIGYFPTYALGNLISAQVWEAVRKDVPDLDDRMRRGDFSALLDWLRRKIHVHGSKYQPQELVQRVTGSKIDPAPYVRYLRTKFGEIYGM
jgi:carboxypeptidase Taq